MTVNIRGKEYVTVDERVAMFRADHPRGQILTDFKELGEARCICTAMVIVDGELLATAHAEEVKTSGGVNSTSYVENCETSAVGRALGFLGYGIKGSIASADEVQRAIERQYEAKQAEKVSWRPLADAAELKRMTTLMDDAEFKEWKRAQVAKLGDNPTQEQIDELAAQLIDEIEAIR